MHCTHLRFVRPLDDGIPRSEPMHRFHDELNDDRTGRVEDGEALEGPWIEVPETMSPTITNIELDG